MERNAEEGGNEGRVFMILGAALESCNSLRKGASRSFRGWLTFGVELALPSCFDLFSFLSCVSRVGFDFSSPPGPSSRPTLNSYALAYR